MRYFIQQKLRRLLLLIPLRHWRLNQRSRGHEYTLRAGSWSKPEVRVRGLSQSKLFVLEQGGVSVCTTLNEAPYDVRIVRGRDELTSPFWHTAQILLLLLAILCCLAVGLTLAYFTAEDEKTHIVPLESIQLSLAEEWQEETGVGYQAGLTAVKSPTLTADSGVMYARISMRVEESILDEAGGTTTRLITDPERLTLIEGILYADTHNLLQPGTPYSREDIQDTAGVWQMFNPEYFLAPSSPEPGLYYFEYNGIMDAQTSATLFTKVVIPSDYSQTDLERMGSFIITLEGQGIQSFGFTSQNQAMKELDKVVS